MFVKLRNTGEHNVGQQKETKGDRGNTGLDGEKQGKMLKDMVMDTARYCIGWDGRVGKIMVIYWLGLSIS